MTTQNILSRSSQAATPALFTFVLPFLCAGPLEQAAFRFNNLLGALASEFLKYLPSILVEAAGRLGSYALDHVQLFSCAESLATLCSIFRLVSSAVWQ